MSGTPKGSARNASWFKAGGASSSEPSNTGVSPSFLNLLRPSKDEKTKKGPRRNKPLKQILANERLRAKQVSDLLSKNNPSVDDDVDMATAPDDQSNTTDQPHQSQSQPVAVNKKARREILGTINPEVNYNTCQSLLFNLTQLNITDLNLLIPWSRSGHRSSAIGHSSKKYCDITGLSALRRSETRLRYHNAEVYELIRTFVSHPYQVSIPLKSHSLTPVPLSYRPKDPAWIKAISLYVVHISRFDENVASATRSIDRALVVV
ncbi:hypothetical protein H4Q26_008668 [Puccinia striiformis f. sp. tritici PST-130]|nr:hypothetical protein H4Q26_008668 [Puccinia striiformis f. sp. tritici PST-130]